MSLDSPENDATPVVNSWNEWDPLEEVIVGILDGAAALTWEVAFEAVTAKEHVDRKIAPIRLWIALIAECTENLSKILRRYLDSDPRQKSNAQRQAVALLKLPPDSVLA